MKNRLFKLMLCAILSISLLLFCSDVFAENIESGFNYSWCENTGWINLEPGGDGGFGVEVGGSAVTGYMWGENIGWVSLSCINNDSCYKVNYGVANAGGTLWGYAWGQNVGWINFAPAEGGVFIDPQSGEFSGYAWGENIGWINFAPNGIPVKTSWTGEGDVVKPQVAAGWLHTVGLRSDGTVVAVGYNEYGQLDVVDWENIVQVTAGVHHTVGLKSDGTVVAVGAPHHGQLDVGSWSRIVQVAAGGYHTVGLRSDGTVVAVGHNFWGECEVGSWSHIGQVAAGEYHTVGLKSDGTVVAVGRDIYNQLDVGSWSDIVQVAAGRTHTVGLKSDGTVVAVGYNGYGECDVDDWENIVQVAAGGSYTVGLRSDGTVMAVGYNEYGQLDVVDWENIVQVAVRGYHTVGLRSDGTVVAVGRNDYYQCSLSYYNLQVADSDEDGIRDEIDENPLASSTEFSDIHLGGLTSGSVVGLDAGITIEIMDASDPAKGVRVLVSGLPDEQAKIRIDGSSGLYKLEPGEYIFTSGSVSLQCLAGKAEVVFTIEDTIIVVLVEGTAVFEEDIVADELEELIVQAVEGNVTLDGEVLPPGQSQTTISVVIDIKPGSDPNCINIDGHGAIPVAILSSDDFDATQVDPATVSLDGQEVRVVGKGNMQAHIEDVDGDGAGDLVVQIEDEDGTYQEGDTVAVLTAKTFNDLSIIGKDALCIVP